MLKEALQASVGLPVDREIPVIGFIGRLEEQKGSDILVAAISKFIGLNVQIIILVSSKLHHSVLCCLDNVSDHIAITLFRPYLSGNWQEEV